MSIMQSKHYVKKISLIGDSSVGKTSLIRRFVIDVFDDKYIATIGSKVTKHNTTFKYPDKTVFLTMMIWDLLGQKEYSRIRTQGMSGSHGVIIVSDLSRPETVASVGEFWLRETRALLGPVQVVLVGNKSDLADENSPAAEALKVLGAASGVPIMFCSAKTGRNVEDMFRKMGEMMLPAEDADKKRNAAGERGSLTRAADEIVCDFCEQYGDTVRAMDIVEREFSKAKVNVKKPAKETLLMAIEYLSDVERDVHGRDVSEVNKLRRWKMIDDAQ